MEEILIESECRHAMIESGAWYQATTLSERQALLRGSDRCFSEALSNREMALQKLQRWKKQPPFQKGNYFSERLAMDELSEDDLLLLLANPIEPSCFVTPPVWLQEIIHAFEDRDNGVLVQLPLQKIEDANTLAFLQILKPFLRRGVARLHAGVEKLGQEYAHLPFDPLTIESLLFARLPRLLLPRLTRTVVLELNVARVQGLLQGETPEQRFQYFLQQLALPGGMLPICEEYPVLARQIVEAVERWATCALEFLERLCGDWGQICQVFYAGNDAGVLVDVQEDAGDTHRGGRSVIMLRWSSGLRLVYKPRSLAIDGHFQELLGWLNAQGFLPSFRLLTLIDKGTYGWCEFVEAVECGTPEEVKRFYQRQGGYLALLYALEATDFHAENVIAAGEYPMLIDLEALFQSYVQLQLEGAETFNQSVLRVGFLPQRVWSNNQAAGIDVSGLGGQAGQLTPVPVSLWKEKGTDQMHLTRERIALSLGSHRPRLNGQDVDTLAYSDEIVSGFAALYRLLMQRRSVLLGTMLPRFAHDEIRSLQRPSNHYATLLSDSFHPNALRDALDRDRVFDRLWMGMTQLPYLARIIPAERADLLHGDIPFFSTYPVSRDLYPTSGKPIHEFFCESGLALVEKRVRQLDVQDMERQIWVIQASLASLMMPGGEEIARGTGGLRLSQSRVTYERLVMLARSIGDRLEQLAFPGAGSIGWLGVSPVNEREWQLLPAGIDLYGGLPGIAFFLAYLGMLTGEERYTTLARLAVRTTRMQIARHKKYACIGAFEGLGGWIYLLSHLGMLWREPALYQEAEGIVERLPALIGQDELLDFLSGSAGCIVALLSLNAVRPSRETLDAARLCGEHLVARARTMEAGIGWETKHEPCALTGLSHGNAGMALSLIRLGAACSEEYLRRAALEALAYERSLFSPAKQNWPDLRRSSGGQKGGEPAYMAAWCHGAPGIGLARLGMLPYVDDATLYVEVGAAVQTTVAHGFGRNHSLCHGDMGNVELLLMATRLLPEALYSEHLARVVPALLDSIDIRRWQSGIPTGIETPGLMAGLAGTGYALLRLAAPDRVPSLLLLEPPLVQGL